MFCRFFSTLGKYRRYKVLLSEEELDKHVIVNYKKDFYLTIVLQNRKPQSSSKNLFGGSLKVASHCAAIVF